MNIVWFTWKDRSHPQAGGAEVVAHQLGRHLATGGHRVTFITAHYPGAALAEDLAGYRIIRVGGRFTVYLAAWRYYRQHRAELQPDLVIDECNTIPFFAGWYARTPTILFFHMLCRRIWFYELPQPFSTIGYLAEPLYLRLLRRGPVVTVSQSTKQDLVRHGFPDRNIHLISEGLETSPVPDLAAITKYPQPTLLSFGAIRPMKRTLDQIKAFELAKATIPDLCLIVAGDHSGPYGRQVLEYIRASPHTQDITVLGKVTNDKKLELMQRSLLILVTSVKEGWGLIVTEAASQGTPAVVYNVDGLRDSVRHNQTGLITLANTPAVLAQSATSLLADPSRYQSLRQAAWHWSKHITFDRSHADFLKILRAN